MFDLDDTLVDTRGLRPLRDARKWKEAVASLHVTSAFPGVLELVSHLNDRLIPWCVVTTSVSYYAAAVLRHHSLGSPLLVAYHDAKRKPHPECVTLALNKLGVSAQHSIGVGDHLNDILAYRGAGLLSFGAGWSPMLHMEGWDEVVASPLDLLRYV